MTLDLKKNKNKKMNIKQPNIPKTKTPPNTKLMKENYEKLQKLTGSGFVQIHKK